MKNFKKILNNFVMKLFLSDSKALNAKKINKKEKSPIGYQIIDNDGNSKVYSQRHIFRTLINAMDFANANNGLCEYEIKPIFSEDIEDPIYIDTNLCR